ncbi:unnamed protein product [Phaeothamnion confervicola]
MPRLVVYHKVFLIPANFLSPLLQGPSNSAQNLFPKEKLQNGLQQARGLLSFGWTSMREGVDAIGQSETVAKIKETTIPVLEKTIDGMSKVGAGVVAATDRTVKVAGEKIEEAKPVVGRWAAGARQASARAFETAKEQSSKGVEQVRRAVAARRDSEDDRESGDGSGGGGGEGSSSRDDADDAGSNNGPIAV